VFCWGNLQLKLSVKLILFLFIVSSIIGPIIIHHLRSQINKPLFYILYNFLTVIVKLRLIEIIKLVIHHAIIRIGCVALVLLLLLLVKVTLLRELSVGVHVLNVCVYTFCVITVLTFLFFLLRSWSCLVVGQSYPKILNQLL